jgi:hypothetical protein
MTTDPRAEFASFSDEELRDELEGLRQLEENIRQDLERGRPTQAEAEKAIDAWQARASAWLDAHVADAYSHRNAQINSVGGRKVENVATLVVIASDEFATAMRERFAAKRPSEADLEPTRARLAETSRRRKAMKAELDLRKLYELRASEEAKRQAALEAMSASE